MTESLALPLAQGVGVEASYGTTTESSISTFTYTPTSSASIGANTRTPRTDGDTGTGSNGWKGNYYYNWFSATAEQGTTSTSANTDVNGSICPKGWRLPAIYSIDTIRSWGALTNVYLGITGYTSTNTGYLTLEATPISLQRSGRYTNNTFYVGGANGFYWSSIAQSTSEALSMNFGSSAIYPNDHGGKVYDGYALRCLAVR